jgi:hypothetical protein
MPADFWYELDLASKQSGKPIQRFPTRSETAEPRPAV